MKHPINKAFPIDSSSDFVFTSMEKIPELALEVYSSTEQLLRIIMFSLNLFSSEAAACLKAWIKTVHKWTKQNERRVLSPTSFSHDVQLLGLAVDDLWQVTMLSYTLDLGVVLEFFLQFLVIEHSCFLSGTKLYKESPVLTLCKW